MTGSYHPYFGFYNGAHSVSAKRLLRCAVSYEAGYDQIVRGEVR